MLQLALVNCITFSCHIDSCCQVCSPHTHTHSQHPPTHTHSWTESSPVCLSFRSAKSSQVRAAWLCGCLAIDCSSYYENWQSAHCGKTIRGQMKFPVLLCCSLSIHLGIWLAPQALFIQRLLIICGFCSTRKIVRICEFDSRECKP